MQQKRYKVRKYRTYLLAIFGSAEHSLGITEHLAVQQIIARNVRAEAARYDFSNEDLCKLLNKSKTALHSRLVGEVEFRTSELATLAEAMGIEVIDFFEGISRRAAVA